MTQKPNHNRRVVEDGPHVAEVLGVLGGEIKTPESLTSITGKAVQIIRNSVDPIAGPPDAGLEERENDGLLYGLIQSGKTSIITVAAAMAADNGFQCIVVLTSDIDLLYDQTLERVKKALPGLNVLGKNDWKDAQRFERQLRMPPFVIVCSKNGRKLSGLLDAFKAARAKGLSAMIIDDEADQASLNTHTSKRGLHQIGRRPSEFESMCCSSSAIGRAERPRLRLGRHSRAMSFGRLRHGFLPSRM